MIYARIFCSSLQGNHEITASRFPHQVHYPPIAKSMATEMLFRKISLSSKITNQSTYENNSNNGINLYL